MDRGVWQAMVCRVSQSWTWVEELSVHTAQGFLTLKNNIIPRTLPKLISFQVLLCLNCHGKFLVSFV